ncbi:hypothetical protein AWC30_03655 [Mycolicibacillus trivialis]|uniref:Uncharacterized protein n=2 Tax=Mycolicibacillus trivialis TaxID=1798 RepID=A0A1X2EPY3_9MYCO|nr:hypothetical protein AWC30_03655 [Mycolicibacillus trivialis]
MRESAPRRWLANAVALVAAVVLTVALTGTLTDSGVGGLAGSAGDGVTARPTEPAVALSANTDLLDRWRDVVAEPGARTGIGLVTALPGSKIVPHGSTDGLHSLTKIIVPQVLPADLGDHSRYLISWAIDLMFSPLSNLVADGRWGAYLSPLVALGSTAVGLVGDLAGENPDPVAATWRLAHLPTDLYGAFRYGADLNLAPLARMFGDAGMLPADFDASALHVGLGGHSTHTPKLRDHFPKLGSLSRLVLGLPR